jgi:hypothetical protein
MPTILAGEKYLLPPCIYVNEENVRGGKKGKVGKGIFFYTKSGKKQA